MKIEIVVDPARPAPAQSLASRVAPPPQAAPANGVQTQAPRLVSAQFVAAHAAHSNGILQGPAVDHEEGEVEVGEEERVKLRGPRKALPILMLRWRFVSIFSLSRRRRYSLFVLSGLHR
jgi:hypothetical protein